VLDHLLGLLARYGPFELTLAVGQGTPDDQLTMAAQALGGQLRTALRAPDARGHGSAHLPEAEALAHVALEATDQPLLASNVDLSAAHIGGLDADLADRFLRELAESAGITLHVRLVEGKDTQHVLEAIFKALGVALGQACR
jgi:imidazoleglycerol-phosphate dehydratase